MLPQNPLKSTGFRETALVRSSDSGDGSRAPPLLRPLPDQCERHIATRTLVTPRDNSEKVRERVRNRSESHGIASGIRTLVTAAASGKAPCPAVRDLFSGPSGDRTVVTPAATGENSHPFPSNQLRGADPPENSDSGDAAGWMKNGENRTAIRWKPVR